MKAIITNESKEQESLDRIKNDSLSYISQASVRSYLKVELQKGDLENLQALVDKSIPMKPTYPKEYPVPTCAVCGSNLGDNKFCRECGREIDWSDSNE
jgi:hypothetical protein